MKNGLLFLLAIVLAQTTIIQADHWQGFPAGPYQQQCEFLRSSFENSHLRILCNNFFIKAFNSDSLWPPLPKKLSWDITTTSCLPGSITLDQFGRPFCKTKTGILQADSVSLSLADFYKYSWVAQFPSFFRPFLKTFGPFVCKANTDLFSCNLASAHYQNGILTASCPNSTQQFVTSSLNTTKCLPGTIKVGNGKLSCQPSPIANDWINRFPLLYARHTCSMNETFYHNGYLLAKCFDNHNNPVYTLLDLKKCDAQGYNVIDSFWWHTNPAANAKGRPACINSITRDHIIAPVISEWFYNHLVKDWNLK